MFVQVVFKYVRVLFQHIYSLCQFPFMQYLVSRQIFHNNLGPERGIFSKILKGFLPNQSNYYVMTGTIEII